MVDPLVLSWLTMLKLCGPLAFMTSQIPNILVVEADKQINSEMQRYLVSRAGWSVDSACSAQEARDLLAKNDYSVVLTGIAFPDGSGRDVVRLAQEKSAEVHAVILAGPMEAQLLEIQSGEQKVELLSKPFRLKDLTSLIAGITGQSAKEKSCPIFIETDKVQSLLSSSASDVSETLTNKERDIIDVLLRAPGVPVSREEVFRRVYRTEMSHGDRTVDVYIGKLRKKICTVSQGAYTIEHMRGRGYAVRMVSAVTKASA